MIKNIIFTLAILVSSTVSASDNTGLSLSAFRLSQLSVVQSGGNYYTGSLGWAPTYHFTQGFGIRANAAASLIKTRLGEKSVVPTLMGLLAYSLSNSWSAEAGAGLQLFGSNGGTRTVVGGNAVYQLAQHFIVFQHLFAGYTAALVRSNLTHEIQVGLGTSF